jgi:hypothetical protein
MPTDQEEKPAKPRTRSRKPSGQRNPKATVKAQVSPGQVKLEADQIGAMSPVMEDAAIEVAPADIVAEVAAAETAPVETAPVETIAAEETAPAELVSDIAPVAVAMEQIQENKAEEAPLFGEVLPPEVRDAPPQATGFSGIALAYGEYSRKSWANGRFLVERLMTVRSLDEAIEIQGEFAKQAYMNFIMQSQKICVLYSEWALGFFRPFEKFAAGWPRIGR